MSAIFVNRQIKFIADNTGKPIEKQVSGKRIEPAGDDASGPAVSEKTRTRINGLFQAEKKAGNGLSFVQAAEWYLHQLNDILLQDQRIKAFIESMSVKALSLIETEDHNALSPLSETRMPWLIMSIQP